MIDDETFRSRLEASLKKSYPKLEPTVIIRGDGLVKLRCVVEGKKWGTVWRLRPGRGRSSSMILVRKQFRLALRRLVQEMRAAGINP